LIFLRARWYNPGDGRFQSRDTWGGDINHPLSLNRWGYVEGNPINFTDPSGHYIYNRMKAVNYAINWDQSSASGLDPQYDFTTNKCYETTDFSNQCTLFASMVLHHGGVEDPRSDPYKNGTSDNSSLYYWNIDGLLESNYYSEKGCQYQPYTAIQTPMFFDFVTSEVGTKLFTYQNPPHYNNDVLYEEDSIDQDWESLLSANRGLILPGDLVFYDISGGFKWDHVAVVVGWGLPTTFGTGTEQSKDPLYTERLLEWAYSFSCSPSDDKLPLRPVVVDRSGEINYEYWRSLDNTSQQVDEIAVVHIENK